MMSESVQGQLREPRSELQTRLVAWGRRRVEAAERRWSERYDAYREAERLYRAFREPDSQDNQTKQDRLTEGVEKIVVPYSYAVIQSTLAFFMTVFTQRKPIIPVEGKGPADVRAAILMESLLEHQWDTMDPSGIMILMQWLLDSLRYGIGIVKNVWTVREWPDFVRQVVPMTDPVSGAPVGYQDTLLKRDVVAYEGNECLNVSPFDWLPDPHRPLSEFQKGEFVIHRMRRSWTELRQRQAEGLYLGIEHIPKHTLDSGVFGSGSGFMTDRASEMPRIMHMDEGENVGVDESGQPYVTIHEMWAYVDPDDLGLNEHEPSPRRLTPRSEGTPELWVFTFANLARCLRAEPAMLPGRRFPFEIIELNYDVHAPANFGLVETFRGLQYHLSWLFNARMQAVRRTLNNEMVVDPSMIEELDLLDPEPGRLLRLKRAAYGSQAVDKAVYPLPVQDVTAGHMQDAKAVTDLIETVTGANRLIMGLPNTGRRAATEVQGQLNLSSGRMKLLIEIATRQGLIPLAGQQARNTQTFLDQQTLSLREPYARLFGQPLVKVTPEMLQGEFYFPIGEQGMPTDRQFEANVWKELLTLVLQSAGPAAFTQIPWANAVWGRFLRAMGVRDLQTFGVTLPQLVLQPDEIVQQQAQQGNIVGQAGADGFALPPASATPGVGNNGMNT